MRVVGSPCADVLYDCPQLPVVPVWPQPQALLLEGPVAATAVAVADA